MKYSFYGKKCLVVMLVLTALCLATTPVKANPIVYEFFRHRLGGLEWYYCLRYVSCFDLHFRRYRKCYRIFRCRFRVLVK